MSTTLTEPIEPSEIDSLPDIRLIVADLDGTLLDDDHHLPEHFAALVHELHGRGIVFCPASGRQYFNLLERFEEFADDMVFIAENGTYVVSRGREISSDCIATGAVAPLVTAARALAASGIDVGVVVCAKQKAYIERTDPAFLAEVGTCFSRLQIVDDLLEVADDAVLKVAIFDFGSAEVTTAPAFARFRDSVQVVISGEHWVDVMNPTANKGQGVRRLQRALGITPAQTVVFGDFLNDLELMDAGDFSFAMENAHPELRARARYVAPRNSENGVVRTIASLLQLPGFDET
ncbi:MAG: Cof-type HAD-IIB family hydrolase [Rhodoglobus sp.]